MTRADTSERYRWFQPDHASPTARMRLFLLHHAGGTAASYAAWPALFPADIAVQAIQFPGRHDRPGEQPFTRIESLVDALSEALSDELDERPYALFGHSMGGLIAYRVAVALSGCDHGPVLLGVSGFGRGFRFAEIPDEHATDSEVIARMRKLGVLPDPVSAHPELLRMLLPTLRADMALCLDYRDDGVGLDCPIIAYSGSTDPLIEPGTMIEWRTRTDTFLGAIEFPGAHFYLDDHAVAVATDLGRRLQRFAVTERRE